MAQEVACGSDDWPDLEFFELVEHVVEGERAVESYHAIFGHLFEMLDDLCVFPVIHRIL